MILTAIYDGQSSSPKGIEIYVTATGSYDGWTIEQQFNSGTSWSVGYTFDTTVYTGGDFLYVTSTASDPTITGAGGVLIADSSFNSNGDDRVRIFDGSSTVDQHGATDTDGSGTDWEFVDSYVIRNAGTTADGTFTIGDWTYAPVNTLDSGNAPLAAALGTYSPPAVPEPSTALLSGLALFGLVRRKR